MSSFLALMQKVSLIALLISLLAVGAARAQCIRSWNASPEGVYDAPTYQPRVEAMVSWTPTGSSTPVLVVGGNFQAAGEVGANYIAYWDGSLWHKLGLGFNAPVRALGVLNGVLYAGGEFTASSSTPLHYFARWTGSAWQDASLGTNGPVWAIANNGAELLVGGAFTQENGGALSSRHIARYNGSAWTSFATGPAATVRAIAVLNGQPIVIDEESGSTPQYNEVMYKWTGSTWLLVDRLYYAGGMGVVDGNLFYSTLIRASGTGVLGECASYNEYGIKKYDGTTTQRVQLYRSVSSFVFYNGQLYALGEVRHFCPHAITGGATGPWMATWNGSQWLDISTLNPGFSDGLLGTADGILYVGGTFDHVTPQTQATNIARLIGFQWQPLAVGLDGTVTCSRPGYLEVGGNFTHEGFSSVPYEASWNGQVWTGPTAFNGPVTCLGNYSANPLTLSSTVASGSFTQIAGTSFNHIALRDEFGTSWAAMGSGINGPALTTLQVGAGIHHNDLIVGGQFITAGSLIVNRIARWTGSDWASLGTGMNSDVRALANFGGLIVAGGSFATAGSVSAANIAGWNGSAWAPIGGGMNGAVRSLLVYNGQLIAGGDFTMAGGVPAAHLAAWNGTSWSAFNGGADGTVNAMVISGVDLVIGGSFAHVNGSSVAAANLADWNGSEWSSIGGTDGPVLTLSLSNGSLLAGGSFTHAGGQYSPYAAIAPTPGDPSVVNQPVDTSACPGDSAWFYAGVDPGAWFVAVTYNWYHNGVIMNDGVNASGSSYSQAHTAMVTITNVTQADAGSYWCRANTACGQNVTTSTAQLTLGGPGCCGSADFNCDGDLGTDSDIEGFFACLAGNCPAAPCQSTADFNADGDLGTDSDIEAFFRVLGGGNC